MKKIKSGNVVRYCKPSTLDENGNPTGASFQRRVERDEQYLSVYLLEFFGRETEKDNVSEVKKEMERKNFKFKNRGVFATLNIEDSQSYILRKIWFHDWKSSSAPAEGTKSKNTKTAITTAFNFIIQTPF